jgi:RHS repeat-associated protein
MAYRLSAIQTPAGRYSLTYKPDNDPILPSLLDSIEYCANGDCLEPLTFDWDGGGYSWNAAPALGSGVTQDQTFIPPYSMTVPAPPNTTREGGTQIVDLDGDGRVDFIKAFQPWGANYPGLKIQQAFRNNGAGWTKMPDWALPRNLYDDHNGRLGTYLADFDGDGLLDLIHDAPELGLHSPEVFLNRLRPDLGGKWVQRPDTWNLPSRWGAINFRDKDMVMDMNGDGRIDLVRLNPRYLIRPPTRDNPAEYSNPELWVAINTGSGWLDDDTYILQLGTTDEWSKYHFEDVNRDGLPDIVGKTTVVLNRAKPDEYGLIWTSTTLYVDTHADTTPGARLIGDLDGDGLYDVVTSPPPKITQVTSGTCGNVVAPQFTYQVQAATVAMASGAGYSADVMFSSSLNGLRPTVDQFDLCYANDEYDFTSLVDVNGDGLADVIMNHRAEADLLYLHGRTLINTGSRFVDMNGATSWTTEVGPNPSPAITSGIRNVDGDIVDTAGGYVDLNGDGLSDALGGAEPTAYINGFRPPVITNFPRGLAKKAFVKYEYITSAEAQADGTYTDDAARAPGTTYLALPLRVAASVTTEDGSGTGGTGKTTYQYHSLRGSAAGRGPQGFASTSSYDEISNVTTTTAYAQFYPFTGMVTSTTRKTGDSLTGGSTTVNCYMLADGDDGHPCLDVSSPDFGNNLGPEASISIYPKSVQDYALAIGTTTTDVIKTTSTFEYDGHGNPTRIDVKTTHVGGDNETFDKATENTYKTPGSREQQLGKITKTIVTTTRTAPLDDNNEPIVRTSEFEYGEVNSFKPDLLPVQTTLALTKTKREPNAGAPLELHSVFGYDIYGNVTTTVDCASDFGSCATDASPTLPFRKSTISFDPADYHGTSGVGLLSSPSYTQPGRFPVVATNAAGHKSYSIYDPVLGTVLQTTDPNHLSTCYQYDSFGFKTMDIARCGGDNITTMTSRWYDENDLDHQNTRFVTLIVPPVGGESWAYADDFGRTIYAVTRSFDGGFVMKQSTFNRQGQPAVDVQPRIAGVDTGWLTRYGYDALNRNTSVVKDLGKIDPDQPSVQATTTIIFNGLTTETDVTVAGKVQKHTERKNAIGKAAWIEDNNGKRLTYKYDAEGRVTDVTDLQGPAGNGVHYVYDRLGRKIQETGADFNSKSYTYDGFGDVMTVTDGNGRTTSMTYDSLGRARTKTDSSGTAEWVYDVAPGPGIGKIASVISPPDSRLASPCTIPHASQTDGNRSGRSYTYDANGNVGHVDECTDGEVFTTRYSTDPVGRPSTVTYPNTGGSSLTVQYNYNEMGYLNALLDASDQKVLWAAKSMNALGQVTDEYTRNGVETTSDRNRAIGALMGTTSQSVADGNRKIQDWAFTYDGFGNLATRVRTDDLNAGNSFEDFTYDGLNRLKTSHVRVPLWGHEVLEGFEYDDYGNLTTKAGKTYHYSTGCGGGPHAICSIDDGDPFEYDGNGNMTASAGRTITYNEGNKATSIVKGSADVEFVYDADGNRVVQDVGMSNAGVFTSTARTVYVGMGGTGKNLYQRTTNGSTEEHVMFLYVPGAHGGNAMAVRSVTMTPGSNPVTQTRYYYYDHLGSVTAMSDEAGHVVDSIQAGTAAANLGYDPWGARRNPDGRSADPSTFSQLVGHREYTGHEAIPDVGLINMNGRVYDPVIGRFLSADVGIQDLTDLQSFNLYSYVANNPLRFTDPTGYRRRGSNWAQKAFFIEIGIVGAIACAGSGIACAMELAFVTAVWTSAVIMSQGGSFDQALVAGAAGMFAGLIGGALGGAAANLVGEGILGSFVSGAVSGAVSDVLATEMVGGNLTWTGVLEGAAVGAAMSAGTAAIASLNPVSQESAARGWGRSANPADELERVLAANSSGKNASEIAAEALNDLNISEAVKYAREYLSSAPKVACGGPCVFLAHEAGELAEEAIPVLEEFGGTLSQRLGQYGQRFVESLTDLEENTERIVVGLRLRVPDLLDEAGGFIGEVKNVARQAFTSQLRDMVSYAAERGWTLDLFTRTNTTLTAPLLDAWRQGLVNIHPIIPPPF